MKTRSGRVWLGIVAVGGMAWGCSDDGQGPVMVITRGEMVDLEDHLEKGKYVLFVFSADW